MIVSFISIAGDPTEQKSANDIQKLAAFLLVEALRLLVDPLSADSSRTPFDFSPLQQQRQPGGDRQNQPNQTVWHLAAKFNAVESFKYLIARARTFDPYATTAKA
jgi:hypothetical protein